MFYRVVMKMFKLMLFIFSAFMIVMSKNVLALDVENDYEAEIKQIFTYNALSNGDVVLYITVTNANGQSLTCTTGVYMSQSDPGIQRTLSAALAARASGAKVIIQADKDPAARWSGDNNICHLIGLKY